MLLVFQSYSFCYRTFLYPFPVLTCGVICNISCLYSPRPASYCYYYPICICYSLRSISIVLCQLHLHSFHFPCWILMCYLYSSFGIHLLWCLLSFCTSHCQCTMVILWLPLFCTPLLRISAAYFALLSCYFCSLPLLYILHVPFCSCSSILFDSQGPRMQEMSNTQRNGKNIRSKDKSLVFLFFA